jgi:hypothetical protein
MGLPHRQPGSPQPRGLARLFPAFKPWWESMATWTTLPPETKTLLVEGLKEEIGDRSPSDIARWRDEKLSGLLKLIFDG